LLEQLEKNTGQKKEVFLNELLNNETTWKDLEDFNYIEEAKKDPNNISLTHEEAIIYLRNLRLHKRLHGVQI
jgi:predicted DNA-binding protein